MNIFNIKYYQEEYMDINLELLRTFKIVAQLGSISKAAKKLCLTQPSITKSIKKL